MAGMRGFFRVWGGMRQVIGLGLFYSRHGIHTRRLIEAVPVPDPNHSPASHTRLSGEVPSPVHPLGQTPARLLLQYIGAGHMVTHESRGRYQARAGKSQTHLIWGTRRNG